jgi:hypothetical protein
VFRPFFKGDSWDAWRAFLASLFALPMTAEQTAIYREHTGRNDAPTVPSNEGWLVCGRRSGKSFMLAGDTAISLWLTTTADRLGRRASALMVWPIKGGAHDHEIHQACCTTCRC